jgi:hypothetical protein
MLALQPGESRPFKLRVVYGYWGGAGAVSHAQLSLIGWGGNWKWDESALGAWGEQFTYDPTHHIGGAFMDDIRPAFTTSYGSNPTHGWTENVGGGDFLIYRDSADTYRWIKRLKTCYHQTGPNLTEIFYSGITDDDRIRVTYASRAVSTHDYHRRFHDYTYEFLQDVVSPQRLVFHQMAADFYLTAAYTNYYLGDEAGLLSAHAIDAGGNTYKGSPIAFDGKWLSIDDFKGGKNPAKALRGIIPLSSILNGSPFPLYLHKYGRSWGTPTMLFDMSSDSVNRSYSAGDVVEGRMAFILPPQHVTNYWGGDAELTGRLTAYGDAAWEPVRDEFVQNVQMSVSVHQGTLLRNYPLEIRPEIHGSVLADFTINGGGIGHVPVQLKSAEPGLELKVQRWSGDAWVDYETAALEENRYYQAVMNADGTMDYTFSIPRPSLNLGEAWRVRLARFKLHENPDFPDQAVLVSQLENTHSAGLQYTGGGGPNNSGLGQSFRFAAPQTLRAITFQKSGHLVMPAGTHEVKLWIGEYDSTTDPNNHVVGATRYEDTIDISGQTFADDSFYTINLASNLTLSAGVGYAFQLVFDSLDINHIFDVHRYYEGAGGTDTYADGTIVYQQNVSGTVPFQSLINEPENEMAFALHASSIGQAPSFGVWAAGHGLAGTNALSSADPDRDAANNLYEYALGGNPTNEADTGHAPVYGPMDEGGTNYMEYTYARRIGTEDELDYRLELATDLVIGNWTNSGYVELPVTGTIDAGFEAVTNRIDTAGKTNEFIRLLIEAQ